MEKALFIPPELFHLKPPFKSLIGTDIRKIAELPVNPDSYNLIKENLLLLIDAFEQVRPAFDEEKLPAKIQEDFLGYSNHLMGYIITIDALSKENLTKYIIDRAPELGLPDEEKLHLLSNFLLTWVIHYQMEYAFLWINRHLDKIKREDLEKDYVEFGIRVWKRIAANDLWEYWKNFLRSIQFGTRRVCLPALETIMKEKELLDTEQLELLEGGIDFVVRWTTKFKQ